MKESKVIARQLMIRIAKQLTTRYLTNLKNSTKIRFRRNLNQQMMRQFLRTKTKATIHQICMLIPKLSLKETNPRGLKEAIKGLNGVSVTCTNQTSITKVTKK